MKPSGREMNRSGVTLKVKRSRNANRQRKEPVVLAKVIFRMDDLVYFAILRGEIFLSCLRRLFFLSFLFFPRYSTTLDIYQTNIIRPRLSSPIFVCPPFFSIRNKPGCTYTYTYICYVATKTEREFSGGSESRVTSICLLAVFVRGRV